jgi:hypothetical protein
MRARRGRLRLAACALLVVAGCGGSDARKPTAAEIDAAQARWRDRTDDVCFEVNRGIGRRGGPEEVDAIAQTVAEGVADVRAGIREIVAVPLAAGGSPAPAAFVRELKALDAELAALPDGGAEMRPAALVQAADRVKPVLRRLEVRAGQAGLTNCMIHTERELVPDAVRRPIFVKRLEPHHSRFVQRLSAYDEPASTPTQLANRMQALGELFDGAAADAATFDPPHDAAKATEVYIAATRRIATVARQFEESLRSGGATASLAALRRHQRAFGRAWRQTDRAYGRMRSRAGAPPAPSADAANLGAQQS